jgi:hypothetical protein
MGELTWDSLGYVANVTCSRYMGPMGGVGGVEGLAWLYGVSEVRSLGILEGPTKTLPHQHRMISRSWT